jgi:hypothetical protein
VLLLLLAWLVPVAGAASQGAGHAEGRAVHLAVWQADRQAVLRPVPQAHLVASHRHGQQAGVPGGTAAAVLPAQAPPPPHARAIVVRHPAAGSLPGPRVAALGARAPPLTAG